MKNLHQLPIFSDRWSYLYLEHGQLISHKSSVSFINKTGEMKIPIAQFTSIWLGPGTSVTHSAIKILADNNCLVCWTGEEGVRLYAHSTGGTHSSSRLLNQAELYANPKTRIRVIRNLYAKYFGFKLSNNLTLEQMRGMEGARMLKYYKEMADKFGVKWSGRSYGQKDWSKEDGLNRALSVANYCLYGLCYAGIVSAGYSSAIGFIHKGKMLSFVYDIADLYKMSFTIPLAFELVSDSVDELERRVRIECRDYFSKNKLVNKIIPDIIEVLDASDNSK